MVTCREDGPVLTVVYRPRGFAIVGAGLFVVGIVLLLVAAMKPHDVRLRCAGADCTMERIAIIGGERVTITDLRGARTTPEELILDANPDVVMGPWVARRGVPSYRVAEAAIEAYVASGRTGTLDASVPVRATLRWFGVAGLALVLGIALLVVFAIGARAVFDRTRDEVRRFGSKVRVKISELVAVDASRNQIVATRRVGPPVMLVSTIGKRHDLSSVAARIRIFIGA